MDDHASNGTRAELIEPGPADAEERAAWLDAGRLLFARECTFKLGVANAAQLPDGGLPEIAFAGRSNVGKSSLVNALTGRKTLARTSNTPGRTQQLNFFDLGGRLMMVDLPGYGFAQAPKDVVKRWQGLIRDYLRGRAQLRRVVVLVDGRHGLKAVDREVMSMLDEAAVNYQVVLTKGDKVKPTDLAHIRGRVAAELTAKHVAAHPVVLATSSAKGDGVAELRAMLTEIAET